MPGAPGCLLLSDFSSVSSASRESSPPTPLTATPVFFCPPGVVNPSSASSGDYIGAFYCWDRILSHLFNASLQPILILISSTVACSGRLHQASLAGPHFDSKGIVPARLIRLKGIRPASLDSCLLLVSFGFFGFRFDWGGSSHISFCQLSDGHCSTSPAPGIWRFKCLNLLRNCQCHSNVDPVLEFDNLIPLCYPCHGSYYKVLRYPIPSTSNPYRDT